MTKWTLLIKFSDLLCFQSEKEENRGSLGCTDRSAAPAEGGGDQPARSVVRNPRHRGPAFPDVSCAGQKAADPVCSHLSGSHVLRYDGCHLQPTGLRRNHGA